MPSKHAGASAKELHGHLHGRRSPQPGHDSSGFDSDPASANSSRPTSPLPPFLGGGGAGSGHFAGPAARDAAGRSMSASSTGSEPSQQQLLLRPPQPGARPVPSRSMSESNASRPMLDVNTEPVARSASPLSGPESHTRSTSPLSGPSSAPAVAERPSPTRAPSPLAKAAEPPRPAAAAKPDEPARSAFWDRYKQQRTEANASQNIALQPVSASDASLSSSGTSTAETALRLLTPMASVDGLREAATSSKLGVDAQEVVIASPVSATTPEHERGHSPSESVDMSRRTSTIAPSDSISSPGVADWPRKDPAAPPVPKLSAPPPPASSAALSAGSTSKRACHRCAGSLRGKKYVQRENGVKLCEECFKEMFLPKVSERALGMTSRRSAHTFLL